ncbi:MAG: HAD-IIIA family hydrolase [Deltaproteobacteria bacterium]|nr:HAD-IIIA family hydrolase [Deltaproteobacteria bacterium]
MALSTDKTKKIKRLLDKARQVKVLLLDVDGVLTDGRITYNDRGEEIKSFHVRDGLGIKLLQRCGIEVAILTGRISEALLHRCRELKIETVLQGMEPKLAAYEWLLRNRGLVDSQVAYVGDDWVDIQILKRAGLPVAVKNADKGVMAYVDYVTQQDGGQGAVREVCELILEAKGLKEKALAAFTL